MKSFFVLFLSILLATPMAWAQEKPVIYLFPGQGSDYRLFDSLRFDTTAYAIRHIRYPLPERGISLAQYAQLISSQIDTSRPVILIGTSLGGMLCVELSERVAAQKVIIISSAKHRGELPFRYTFQRVVPLYRLLPGGALLLGAKILQPLVEPDRNTNKATFKSMLGAKEPAYVKRTIAMIIQWDRTGHSSKIVHIHGDKDHTLPLRKVSSDYVVKNGSHMMTLTNFKPIQEILEKELDGLAF